MPDNTLDAARQAQVADLLDQFFTAEAAQDWDRVIDLGERLLAMDPPPPPAALRPRTADAYWARGQQYFYKRDYDRALADFTRTIVLGPHWAHYYWWRGRSYYSKKDYDRALDDFRRAIKHGTQEGQYYFDRGTAYQATGERAAARLDFEQAVALGYEPAKRMLQAGPPEE